MKRLSRQPILIRNVVCNAVMLALISVADILQRLPENWNLELIPAQDRPLKFRAIWMHAQNDTHVLYVLGGS